MNLQIIGINKHHNFMINNLILILSYIQWMNVKQILFKMNKYEEEY